ncbi:hypothetical protein CsSME_00042093 [Camellia sinensis var. sinensis]
MAFGTLPILHPLAISTGWRRVVMTNLTLRREARLWSSRAKRHDVDFCCFGQTKDLASFFSISKPIGGGGGLPVFLLCIDMLLCLPKHIRSPRSLNLLN